MSDNHFHKKARADVDVRITEIVVQVPIEAPIVSTIVEVATDIGKKPTYGSLLTKSLFISEGTHFPLHTY